MKTIHKDILQLARVLYLETILFINEIISARRLLDASYFDVNNFSLEKIYRCLVIFLLNL